MQLIMNSYLTENLTHYISWRALVLQLILHKVHIRCYMLEELMIALTEIVKPWIAVTITDKTVLGTLSMTGKLELTLLALLRKKSVFHL